MTLSTSQSAPRPAVFPVIATPGQSQAHAEEKARGFTQGHAAGYAAGLQRASVEAAAARARDDASHAERVQQLDARHAAEVAALRLAGAALAERTAPVLADAEQALFSCALDLAVALLGHELGDDETSARAALARARGLDETESPLVIRMNPADVAVLDRSHDDLPASLTLLGDPGLNRGDAVADYPHGFLDARLGTAVERVRATLLESTLPANNLPTNTLPELTAAGKP